MTLVLVGATYVRPVGEITSLVISPDAGSY